MHGANLWPAVVKFNRGLCDNKAVIKAYEEGEKTIGDVTYQQTGGQNRLGQPASGQSEQET
jgi:hypothetical protein